MRAAPTEAEAALWRILRSKRLDGFRFRRQPPIGSYIVDFVCMAERLVVEADGSHHIDSDYDAARTAWLRAAGYRVLRFWNHDILQRTDNVGQAIYATLTTPSPLEGEGERRSEATARGEGCAAAGDKPNATPDKRRDGH